MELVKYLFILRFVREYSIMLNILYLCKTSAGYNECWDNLNCYRFRVLNWFHK